MKLLCQIIPFLFLTACGYNDFDPIPNEAQRPDSAVTLYDLQEFRVRAGNAITLRFQYVFSGTVIADDRSGNFYRSFIVQDESGAMEIYAGIYDLHVLYPIGRKITMQVQGLKLDRDEESGFFRLGFPTDAGSLGYFQHREILDRYVYRGEMDFNYAPPVKTIPELTERMSGSQVTVQRVRFDLGGKTTWALSPEESWNDSWNYKDLKVRTWEGDSLTVYTSGYASFARDTVPAGWVDLSGIIRKNGKEFRIMLRDLRDVVEL